jgi:hypothetical protein
MRRFKGLHGNRFCGVPQQRLPHHQGSTAIHDGPGTIIDTAKLRVLQLYSKFPAS